MEHKGNTGRILKFLKSHRRGITSKDSFEKFGVTRLSAIIFNLRKDGYNIESKRRTGKNRFGEPVSFVEYFLAKEQ